MARRSRPHPLRPRRSPRPDPRAALERQRELFFSQSSPEVQDRVLAVMGRRVVAIRTCVEIMGSVVLDPAFADFLIAQLEALPSRGIAPVLRKADPYDPE